MINLLEQLTEFRETLYLHLPVYYKGYCEGYRWTARKTRSISKLLRRITELLCLLQVHHPLGIVSSCVQLSWSSFEPCPSEFLWRLYHVRVQKSVSQNMGLWHAELKKQPQGLLTFSNSPHSNPVSPKAQDEALGGSPKFPCLLRNWTSKRNTIAWDSVPEISLTRD